MSLNYYFTRTPFQGEGKIVNINCWSVTGCKLWSPKLAALHTQPPLHLSLIHPSCSGSECWQWAEVERYRIIKYRHNSSERWDVSFIYSLNCLPWCQQASRSRIRYEKLTKISRPFILIYTIRQLRRIQMLRLNVFICGDALLRHLWWWENGWIKSLYREESAQ